MGISYIGASKEKLGQAACCAVKRIHLDARIAKRAAAVGAHLKEGFEVGGGVGRVCGWWGWGAAEKRELQGH
jgi:hypothetical protein